MSSTFLILKSAHGELVRINPNHIQSYYSAGIFTHITMSDGSSVSVEHTDEGLDKALMENYFFVKDCTHVS